MQTILNVSAHIRSIAVVTTEMAGVQISCREQWRGRSTQKLHTCWKLCSSCPCTSSPLHRYQRCACRLHWSTRMLLTAYTTSAGFGYISNWFWLQRQQRWHRYIRSALNRTTLRPCCWFMRHCTCLVTLVAVCGALISHDHGQPAQP